MLIKIHCDVSEGKYDVLGNTEYVPHICTFEVDILSSKRKLKLINWEPLKDIKDGPTK